MIGAEQYGDWWIIYDPPPIPSRDHDWQFQHDEYDGPGDPRQGSGPTRDFCIELIDEFEVKAA